VVDQDLWTLSEFGMSRHGFASLDPRGTVAFPVPEGYGEDPVVVEAEPAPASTEAPSGG